MMRRAILAATGVLLLAFQAGAENQPRISIIIDDLGYRFADDRRAIGLPGPVALAVLPDSPRGPELARLAHRLGKDVLLHLPLEAIEHNGAVEPRSITLDMSREAFRATFARAIASVPGAVGVSNHQGSLLTRHPGHMAWLMQEIRSQEGLFFIDSYTTRHSVALMLAKEVGVPAVRRDVFLDHERSKSAVRRELERLKEEARKKGYAIGIGHPFPETLEVLEKALPLLEEEGFKLVRISELLQEHWNRI